MDLGWKSPIFQVDLKPHPARQDYTPHTNIYLMYHYTTKCCYYTYLRINHHVPARTKLHCAHGQPKRRQCIMYAWKKEKLSDADIRCVLCIEDGGQQYILACGRDCKVHVVGVCARGVWREGAVVFGEWVHCLAWHRDTHRIAVGLRYGGVHVCSVAELLGSVGGVLEAWVLPGHQSTVEAVQFTESGAHLISSSWDGAATVWCMPTGPSTRTWTDHPSTCVVRLAKGDRVLTCSAGYMGDEGVLRGCHVRLFDGIGAREPTTVICQHTASVRSLDCSDKYDHFGSSSNDGTVVLAGWGGERAVRLVSGQQGPPPIMIACRFVLDHQNNERMVAVDLDGYVYMWEEEDYMQYLSEEDGESKQGMSIDIVPTFRKKVCQGLWSIDTMKLDELNTTLIVLSDSKGCVRIFSTNESLKTENEQEFYDVDENVNSNTNTNSNTKQTNYPLVSEIEQYSADIGDVVLFENDTSDHELVLYEYGNNNDENAIPTWNYISDIKPPKKKTIHDGKYYDNVHMVELDSESLGFVHLTLAWNNYEKPEDVADKFVAENNLPDPATYKEQILQYIAMIAMLS